MEEEEEEDRKWRLSLHPSDLHQGVREEIKAPGSFFESLGSSGAQTRSPGDAAAAAALLLALMGIKLATCQERRSNHISREVGRVGGRLGETKALRLRKSEASDAAATFKRPGSLAGVRR